VPVVWWAAVRRFVVTFAMVAATEAGLAVETGAAAMVVVHPDGSVTVFRDDLFQFLPFLGK
jgi:hypothetical protein